MLLIWVAFPLLGKSEVRVHGSHRTIKCLILRPLIGIHGSDRKIVIFFSLM